jgi:hypothetical protein
MNYRHGKADRDGGVYRIAALPQDVSADIAG